MTYGEVCKIVSTNRRLYYRVPCDVRIDSVRDTITIYHPISRIATHCVLIIQEHRI
jgi:hypothetical protein